MRILDLLKRRAMRARNEREEARRAEEAARAAALAEALAAVEEVKAQVALERARGAPSPERVSFRKEIFAVTVVAVLAAMRYVGGAAFEWADREYNIHKCIAANEPRATEFVSLDAYNLRKLQVAEECRMKFEQPSPRR
jgi:hypothetical protein